MVYEVVDIITRSNISLVRPSDLSFFRPDRREVCIPEKLPTMKLPSARTPVCASSNSKNSMEEDPLTGVGGERTDGSATSSERVSSMISFLACPWSPGSGTCRIRDAKLVDTDRRVVLDCPFRFAPLVKPSTAMQLPERKEGPSVKGTAPWAVLSFDRYGT